jgi:CRISPR-associated endonuclease/helicase Cas3
MVERKLNNGRILAKDDGTTLAAHTIRVLQVSDVLLNNLPFDLATIEKLRNDLQPAIMVHDVGKAATGFQKSLEKDAPFWGHRHEILSASFASTLRLSDEIILAVITHHKSIPSTESKGCLLDEDIPWQSDIPPKWSELVDEWSENESLFVREWDEICDYLNGKGRLIGQELNRERNKLTPLTIGKVWLNRIRQHKKIDFDRRQYASLLRGLLISSDHIASSDPHSMPPIIPELKEYKINKHTKREFQKKSCDHIGNLILRAPTGSGKTDAALMWAQSNQRKNGRVFYVLPNRASINSMYLRLKEYFTQENVGLLHSRVASAIYSMREDDLDLDSKLKNQYIARTLNSLAREMWFPIRVCTPHQILRYTLQGKGWDAMLSEFPNSCFIFDEFHAYDPVITGLSIATAKFVIKHGASCLFLSATMPHFLEKFLESELPDIEFLRPNPANVSDREILDLKRHSLEKLDGDILSNIQTIIQEIDKAKSTLVVCNHVPTAQLVYDNIREINDNVVLLHSRLCRSDRNDIEQKLGKVPLPKVLISTQVVEVSLDIDFEQGFFEPAPIDALIQRLGRVNRFGKKRSAAKVVILTEQLHSFKIYDAKIVERSLEELLKLPNPISEQELVEAVDRVYSHGYSKENQFAYEKALNHPRIKKFEENLIAGTHHKWVDEVIAESDGTEEVLPVSLLGEYQRLDSDKLSIEANNLFVPVPIRNMFSMKDQITTFVNRIGRTEKIINKPYSEKRGLSLQQDDDEDGGK